MVLEKRSKVASIPVPTGVSSDTEVWVVEDTQECFLDYEKFIERVDYLSKPQFTCEITGKTGLTFHEARESEATGASKIETLFPEPLRGPILRFVQFSTVSRMHDLVKIVFEHFKNDFFVKENVNVVRDSVKEPCTIMQKTEFPARPDASGNAPPPLVRYTVSLKKRGGMQLDINDSAKLSRPRPSYNKALVRAFLRDFITKDSMQGSPWLVREDYTRQYGVDTNIPVHLRKETLQKLKDEKLKASRKYAVDKNFLQDLADRGKLPGVAAGTKLSDIQLDLLSNLFATNAAERPKQASFQVNGAAATTNGHGKHGSFNEFQLTQAMPPPPPKKTIKFPCEDLDVPRKKKVDVVRPRLKRLDASYPALANVDYQVNPEPVVGYLLQIWSTMNVFNKFFIIDNFSLEDLVQAIAIASNETTVELYEEVHCSLLKSIVGEEGEMLSRSLTDSQDRNWSEESDEEEEEEPEIEAPRTRSARKSRDAAELQKLEKPQPPHFANRVQTQEEWMARMQAADFSFGGWEIAMVGFLTMLSLKDRHKDTCDRILAKVVPTMADVNDDTVVNNYSALDFQSRVEALHLLVTVTAETKPLKARMEELEVESTGIRKEKIQWQSKRKPLQAHRLRLESERKLLHPDAANTTELSNGDEEAEDPDRTDSNPGSREASVEDEDEDEEEADVSHISTRSRAGKRKRDVAEAAADREKAEKAVKKAKSEKSTDEPNEQRFLEVVKELEEVIKQITECEDYIAEYDEQLRQRFVHRSRLLGKDRYLNYYYWFERNGMPFIGNEHGPTAQVEYMNGCLWVHGPDPLEADGVVNLTPKEDEEYAATHDISMADRRAQDEGDDQLANANTWGYLDKPEELTELLAYLDDKGERERKLKKELKAWKDQLVLRMEKRQTYLDSIAASKREESEEPVIGVATRRKKDEVDLRARFPCLAWQNYAARHHFSRSAIHSQGGRPKTANRRKPMAVWTKQKEKLVNEPVEVERGSRRGGRGRR